MGQAKATEAKEDPAGKLDRETAELLQGLRVIQPGVAVLFAFLLTLPFTEKFGEIDRNERGVYFVAFLTATCSLASLVAPGSLYRVRWRKRDKEFLLRVGNRFALAGVAFLAVTIVCSVFLVTDLLYTGIAPFVAIGTAIVLGFLWFGLGVMRHRGDKSSDA